MPAMNAFRSYACEKNEQNLAQAVRCAGLLSVEELWRRENAHCNAVGNLILHLTGNLRQWIVSGLGGRHFERDRPAEFSQRDVLPHAEIVPKFEETVREANEIIAGLTNEMLSREFQIQGYTVRGIVAVFHVVEHLSFHTGQIVHITKTIRNVNLSLYDSGGRRLDANRNRP